MPERQVLYILIYEHKYGHDTFVFSNPERRKECVRNIVREFSKDYDHVLCCEDAVEKAISNWNAITDEREWFEVFEMYLDEGWGPCCETAFYDYSSEKEETDNASRA